MIKTIALALAAVAAAGVGIGTAASSAGAGPAPCIAANLRPSYHGDDGTAGHVNDVWWLTNLGSLTCTIDGFPAVVNYRADGRTLYTTVAHSGTPHTVTLLHNEHARTVLSYVDPGVLGCTPEPATMLTIGWTGTAHPVIAPRGEPACHGELTALPFTHG